MNSGFQVNFIGGKMGYRLAHLQGRNELLIKAIGWKKNSALQVFDVTAGFGQDAFLLAAMGCHVTLFERHPTVAALLKDGLARATLSPLAPIVERMQLIETCAIAYLHNTALESSPDVIYCDPMFEPKAKTAAAKKEMQLLKTLVGQDEDATILVQQALQVAQKRVVVKRALHAPMLVDNPSHVFKGASSRFDIYIV